MMTTQTKWKTAQQVEWRKFCDAMDSGREHGVKVFATLKDAGNKESARRWLFGATATQKRESAARQLAVNDTKSVMREVDFMAADAGFMTNDAL
jgi:hypothetical protein